MGSIVVGKFDDREVSGPVLWVSGAVDAEICFDFLIGAFGLSVRLGMIGGGHG